MKTPPSVHETSSSHETGSSPNAQYQLLRAHVEREVRRSAVIMVTSALRGDGKSLTAYSLATSLAQAGHRTALVAASSAVPAPRDGGPVLVAMPRPEPGSVREATSEFLATSRATYDYTIVDTAPLLSDTAALALAGSVDGVLVTVRVGRAPTADDESTMRIIEQSNGRVIGIVAALPEAIDDFGARPSGTVNVQQPVERRSASGSGMPALKSLQSLVVVMVILLVSSLVALSGADAGGTQRMANAAVRSSSSHN